MHYLYCALQLTFLVLRPDSSASVSPHGLLDLRSLLDDLPSLVLIPGPRARFARQTLNNMSNSDKFDQDAAIVNEEPEVQGVLADGEAGDDSVALNPADASESRSFSLWLVGPVLPRRRREESDPRSRSSALAGGARGRRHRLRDLLSLEPGR